MPALRKIKRKDLDINKYSEALNSAVNYRIYAEYWYLDILTNRKWECLVFGDYRVIMPLPLQFKFGFKFVLQPLYCQQLGVFYKNEISEKLFRDFERKLHQMRVRSYHFNEENTVRYNPEGEKRINYLLNLNQTYERLFEGFRKDRKKDFRRNNSSGFEVVEYADVDLFFSLLRKDYKHLIKTMNHNFTKAFFKAMLEKEFLKSFVLLNENKEPVCCCLLTFSKSRIILHFSARDKEKETKGTFAYLLIHIIKKFSEKKLFLDFEGSSISGIADFNKSFGAEEEEFCFYSNFKWGLRNPKGHIKSK